MSWLLIFIDIILYVFNSYLIYSVPWKSWNFIFFCSGLKLINLIQNTQFGTQIMKEISFLRSNCWLSPTFHWACGAAGVIHSLRILSIIVQTSQHSSVTSSQDGDVTLTTVGCWMNEIFWVRVKQILHWERDGVCPGSRSELNNDKTGRER